MKKTKFIALCLAAVCMLSVFSGCSSKQEADGEKITIRLWNKPGEGDTEWKIETNDRIEIALTEIFPNVNFEFLSAPAGGVDYRQEYD